MLDEGKEVSKHVRQMEEREQMNTQERYRLKVVEKGIQLFLVIAVGYFFVPIISAIVLPFLKYF